MESAPGAPGRINPQRRADFKAEKSFTLALTDRRGRLNEPATILTAVPYDGVKHLEEFAPRLQAFFAEAFEISKRRGATAAVSKRDRPLLAVPLFGVGGGGAGSVRGKMFRVVYREALAAAAHYNVDVAIVLRDPRDYALAQMIRREGRDAWPELTPELHASARELGEIAAESKLVPFMGAGISLSAGAPDWKSLINRLAMDAGVEPEVRRELAKHDVLDQAAYVQYALERRTGADKAAFGRIVADAVNVKRYGIAPPLLAALEAEQAITLNYDRLFEWAAGDGQRPRRVIPGARGDEERWLLKLHGTVDDPASIVLTREDYLGFNADRAALSSLVKATLMTRHLLFVGFGVTDPHFHEIVHDVRRAVPDKGQPFGTVLTIGHDPVKRGLWGDDLKFVEVDTPRMVDVFLDAVLAYGASSHSYLLAKGYLSTLDPEDRIVAEALGKMIDSIPEADRRGTAWDAVAVGLRDLGWGARVEKRSRSALPKGLD
ncbi:MULTISPECIES: SIR2 family protein [unclassified Microbacterium]|uniref:SIR2 family NAD-dependent protein deacylase n=1 Tax=unclassified Microbacterium TaxID=2609290 RepID=UPI0012F7132A|nr:SIR2 family protein [Microbacterium sp. MAH-37]